MKTITICGKEYPIACNALTEILFKKIFGVDILQRIDVIYKFTQKQTTFANQFISDNKDITDTELVSKLSVLMLPDLGEFKLAVTEIGYICCYTANKKIGSYEEWLAGIDKPISSNDDWIVEVTELAVDCFC